MNEHLSPELIGRFVRGTLSEAEAVRAAEHLDGCALCSNRVRSADPLTPLLAALPDPDVPRNELDAAVEMALTRAAEPEAQGFFLTVGTGLVLAAGVLLLAAGEPLGLVGGITAFVRAFVVGSRAVLDVMPAALPLLVVVSAGVLGFSLLAYHLLELARHPRAPGGTRGPALNS